MVWRAPIPMLLRTPCCSECGLGLLGAVATLLIHEPESHTFPETLWLSLISLKDSSGNRLKHIHLIQNPYVFIIFGNFPSPLPKVSFVQIQLFVYICIQTWNLSFKIQRSAYHGNTTDTNIAITLLAKTAFRTCNWI